MCDKEKLKMKYCFISRENHAEIICCDYQKQHMKKLTIILFVFYLLVVGMPILVLSNIAKKFNQTIVWEPSLPRSRIVMNELNMTMKIAPSSEDCIHVLSEVALKIADQIDPGSLVHIVLSDDNTISLSPAVMEDFMTRFQFITTQANTLEQVSDILEVPPDVYIIFISDYQEFHIFNFVMTQINLYTCSWNPGAKFLFLTTTGSGPQPSQYDLVIDTFNFLWHRNTFRAAIIMCQNDGETVTLFSSSPYSKQFHTCKEIINSAQLQVIDLKADDLPEFVIAGYQFEIPEMFMGCPITAGTYPFPPYSVAVTEKVDEKSEIKYKSGIEINLVLLLAARYNLSVKFNTPDYIKYNAWVDVLPNGSTIGMVKDVMEYKADLAFAGAIPAAVTYFRLRQVYINVFNTMSWYVPDPVVLPSWKLVTTIFTRFTWLLLLLIFVFFTVLYYLVWNMSPEAGKTREPLILLMIRLTLGTPTCCSPKVSYLQTLLITWSMFILNLTIMFNTKLFSVLTERPIDFSINTIEDLHESGLESWVPTLYRNYFLDKTECFIRHILEDSMNFSRLEDVVMNFIEKRDFSILAKDDHMSFLLSNKREKVHTIPEKFITYPVSVFLTKGSILTEPLNSIIMKVTQSGLTLKWVDNIRQEVKVKFVSKKGTSGGPSHIVLKREDVFWLYILLVGGLSTAFAVFIMEVCYRKIANVILTRYS